MNIEVKKILDELNSESINERLSEYKMELYDDGEARLMSYLLVLIAELKYEVQKLEKELKLPSHLRFKEIQND